MPCNASDLGGMEYIETDRYNQQLKSSLSKMSNRLQNVDLKIQSNIKNKKSINAKKNTPRHTSKSRTQTQQSNNRMEQTQLTETSFRSSKEK